MERRMKNQHYPSNKHHKSLIETTNRTSKEPPNPHHKSLTKPPTESQKAKQTPHTTTPKSQ
jgi:hypothetical protein